MTCRSWKHTFGLAAVAGSLLISGSAVATPQLSAPELERPRVATRVPPIDLKEIAKKPRPGQVMPQGEPAAPAETAPGAATPATESGTTPKGPTKTTPISTGPVTNIAPERAEIAKATESQEAPAIAPDAIAQRYRAMARPEGPVLITSTNGNGTELRRVVIGSTRSSDSWREARQSETLSGTVEVRTSGAGGLDARLSDTASVRIDRLTRARLGKMDTQTGDATATRIVIELLRGRIEVRPLDGTSCMVATPDSLIIVRDGLSVWYDATLGTRSRPTDINPTPAIQAAPATAPKPGSTTP